jgi:hypothetical protein
MVRAKIAWVRRLLNKRVNLGLEYINWLLYRSFKPSHQMGKWFDHLSIGFGIKTLAVSANFLAFCNVG